MKYRVKCPFCGSSNVERIGGENGNPFDRHAEKIVCRDCGRLLDGGDHKQGDQPFKCRR